MEDFGNVQIVYDTLAVFFSAVGGIIIISWIIFKIRTRKHKNTGRYFVSPETSILQTEFIYVNEEENSPGQCPVYSTTRYEVVNFTRDNIGKTVRPI